MTDLSPGQEVYVKGMPATVVYVRGSVARVHMSGTGKERSVELSRVTPKRESKALSVPVPERLKIDHRFSESDATAPYDRFAHRKVRPVPKPITLRSEPYLAYVRRHPCCLCGTTGPSEAHHWSHHGGVMGSKVDDYRTVPLCQEHHRYWHDHGTLPGFAMDRVRSESLFLREQRELLLGWVDAFGDDGDMVDALIRAIGGQS